MKLLLPLLLLSLFVSSAHAQATDGGGQKVQLRINELMQSNIDCIMDDLNDFPDSWVELYNSGTTSVDLGKNSLTDVTITMNNIQLSQPVFDGKFYQGRWVSLSAEGGALHVKGWKIVKKNSDGTTTEEEISEPQYGFAMPSCQSLAINALFDTSGINTPVDDSWKKANGGWFTLDGRRLNGYPQKRGIYIHNGRKMVIE